MRKNLLLLFLFVFSFSAIHADNNGSCGDNLTWKFTSSDGTLTISGTGNMTDYHFVGEALWYSQREEIKKVVIKDGVRNIGNFTFIYCENLTSVEIPNSVTRVGEHAFSECGGLTSIEIPNSVTIIGTYAFHGCWSLTSVTIPNSVMSIGEHAFEACEKLTSIKIPNSVTNLGYCAFLDCTGLTSITVEKGNTKYDSRDNCNAIIETNSNKLILGCRNTVIPNSVTSIGDYAFYGCEGLTSIEIPNSVTSIGEHAFDFCESLTSVEIPNSVTSIGDGAFNYCESLTSITFKGSTPPEFGNYVFKDVNKSIPVYVPVNSIEAYKSAMEGLGVSNILANPKQLFLNNSDSYTQNSQVDGADVFFTRDYYGYWEALYLPFSLKYEDWKDDFEVARINAVCQYDDNDDGDIDRTVLEFVKMKNDDSVIEPNTPYLIKAKEAGGKTIFVENTTVYKSEEKNIDCSTTTEQFKFTGLYENLTLKQKAFGNYYVMDKGNLSKVTAQSKIGPYRWRMTRENRNSAYGINNNSAKEISIRVVGEETTGIANIQLSSPNTQTYDLNGRRVNENNLKPGMYVKNGRKVIIK